MSNCPKAQPRVSNSKPLRAWEMPAIVMPRTASNGCPMVHSRVRSPTRWISRCAGNCSIASSVTPNLPGQMLSDINDTVWGMRQTIAGCPLNVFRKHIVCAQVPKAYSSKQTTNPQRGRARNRKRGSHEWTRRVWRRLLVRSSETLVMPAYTFAGSSSDAVTWFPSGVQHAAPRFALRLPWRPVFRGGRGRYLERWHDAPGGAQALPRRVHRHRRGGQDDDRGIR